MTAAMVVPDTASMIDDARLNVGWLLRTLAILVLALLLLPGAPAFLPGCAADVMLDAGASAQPACASGGRERADSASWGAVVWWRDVVPGGWQPEWRTGR